MSARIAPPVWLGLAVLALAWAGPLPEWAQTSFIAHMGLHLAVVALACPLLAWGWHAGPSPVPHISWASVAIAASVLELAVVWAWHAPALHRWARAETSGLVLEQASFLLVGLALWAGAWASVGNAAQPRTPSAGGVLALLMTAMHMALLGALLVLAPRPLYGLGCVGGTSLDPLREQQWGGVLMLAVGGSSYLAGALALLWPALRAPTPVRRA